MFNVIETKQFKAIGRNTYRDDNNLINVIILTKSDIGMSAFENCFNIQNVILDVKTIGPRAFKNCKSLRSCKFDNVLIISENAFENCSNLTELRLGSNLISIGKNAFKGCNPIMILCTKLIFVKYLSNQNRELDMRYLFDYSRYLFRSNITNYYNINNTMLAFYNDYDVAIIRTQFQ